MKTPSSGSSRWKSGIAIPCGPPAPIWTYGAITRPTTWASRSAGGWFTMWRHPQGAPTKAGRYSTNRRGGMQALPAISSPATSPAPYRKVEIGSTWYANPFWARAANPSCERMLFALGLDATNLRSFRAIARLRARFEGIHRAHTVMLDGRIRDTAWISVLAPDWPHLRGGLDKRLAIFTARDRAGDTASQLLPGPDRNRRCAPLKFQPAVPARLRALKDIRSFPSQDSVRDLRS